MTELLPMFNFWTVIHINYKVCILFILMIMVKGGSCHDIQAISDLKFNQEGAIVISVKKFHNSHGLRQSMVSDLTFGKNHLMWLATGGGLHSFDGKGFRYFRSPILKNDILRDDEVMRNIAQDAMGDVYVTTSSSILKFKVQEGEYTTIYASQGSYPQLFGGNNRERLIARVPLKGFCAIEKSGKLVALEHVNKIVQADFIPYCWVTDTVNDRLILGGNRGLVIFNRESDKVKMKVTFFPDYPEIKAITVKSDGDIVFVSQSKLYQQNRDGIVNCLGSLGQKKVKTLFIDRQGVLWLSTIDNNLYLSKDLRSFHTVEFTINSSNEKITPFVNIIVCDKDGNLWFGTDSDGLLLYSETALWFKKAEIDFVRSIERWNEGVLVASKEPGLLFVSDDCQKVRRFSLGSNLDKSPIFDLSRDDSGLLWVLSSSGLWSLSAEGGATHEFEDEMTGGKILINQADSLIYTNGRQLFLLRKKELKHKIEKLWMVNFPEITCLTRVKKGVLVGTRFGLYFAHSLAELGELDFFDHHKPIVNANIQSLFLNKEEVWVLTWNGLRLLNKECVKVPLPEFLRSLEEEVLYESIPDEAGRLWLSSNSGLICFDVRNRRIVRFGLENNLQSLEYNRNVSLNAGLLLWFGGIKGVNCIDPLKVFKTAHISAPTLVSLIVADTLYSNGIPVSIPPLRLSYRNGSIEGEVSNYDFLLPNAQSYSFWLVDYDAGWSKPVREGHFRYRNLPPGKYILKAKSWDGLNTPGQEVSLLEVEVEPAYWQTIWFQVVIMVVIIFIVALIVRQIQRVRYMNRIALLEAADSVNRERLRIARDMHDDIGAGLTRISMLSRFINRDRVADEKITLKLNEVGEIADHLVDEMGEIIWAMNPKNDSLPLFVAHIRHYLGDYFSDSIINLTFQISEVLPDIKLSSDIKRNLYLCLKEIAHNTLKHSGATTADLTIECVQSCILIQWCDNGCGFDVSEKLGHGNGLGNLKKRVAEVSGTIDFSSNREQGCCITIKLKQGTQG